MKRALLILLMMLLPLQTAWASMEGVRILTEMNGAPSGVENVGQRSDVSKSPQKTTGQYDRVCCPGCHAFCNFAGAAPTYSFDSSFLIDPSVVAALPDATAYQSHIPDGPIRPNWPAAS